jgi:hypothetical protein
MALKLVFAHLATLFGCVCVVVTAQAAAASGSLPTGIILVKGAWSSSSDVLTPLPERGTLSNHVYSNDYFGLRYPLSADWIEQYEGPPPSDSGYYVLAQIEPADSAQTASRGHVLIAAQDMFFTVTPANNALELVHYYRDHLDADYRVEREPTEVRIANRTFVRLDYVSIAAQLHWHVLTTQIRCHIVEFVFTGRSAKITEQLIDGMNSMTLPTEAGSASGKGGGDSPVCVKNFAIPENIIEREDPIFAEPRFNPVPVRIVIDREGRVKHIHFLSAFPDQVKSISEALLLWRFRPYRSEGQPVEVETGIIFGRAPRAMTSGLP